jgi:hypothetical protein
MALLTVSGKGVSGLFGIAAVLDAASDAVLTIPCAEPSCPLLRSGAAEAVATENRHAAASADAAHASLKLLCLLCRDVIYFPVYSLLISAVNRRNPPQNSTTRP